MIGENKEFNGIPLKLGEIVEKEARTTIRGLIFTWFSIPGGMLIYFLIVYAPILLKSMFSSAFKQEIMSAMGLQTPESIDITEYIFRNIPDFLMVLISIPIVLLVIVWFCWCLVMTSRHFKYSLAITNFRVIGKAGSEVLDSPLNEVKNVFIEQSIWGKMLKFGSIVVSTKSKSVTFKNIHEPYELYRMIMSHASDYAEH